MSILIKLSIVQSVTHISINNENGAFRETFYVSFFFRINFLRQTFGGRNFDGGRVRRRDDLAQRKSEVSLSYIRLKVTKP